MTAYASRQKKIVNSQTRVPPLRLPASSQADDCIQSRLKDQLEELAMEQAEIMAELDRLITRKPRVKQATRVSKPKY
jgi:hypothetical protein